MTSKNDKERGRLDSVLIAAAGGLVLAVAGLGVNMMQMSAGAEQDD